MGCSCTEDKCSASICDHVSMFDTDNADACSIDGSSIRGRFPYDAFGRIIIDVSTVSLDVSFFILGLYCIPAALLCHGYVLSLFLS